MSFSDPGPCDVCGERPYNVIGYDGFKVCRECYDQLFAWQRAVDAERTATDGGPWPQTCPRRSESMGPWKMDEENADSWRILSDYRAVRQKACSFCGSLHPDDFMAAVRAGEKVGPTDKNYKAYLGEGHSKFYYQHLSDDQRREFVELHNAGTMNVGVPGHFYRLPFFMVRVSKEHES
jgi:hypothetical protein